VRRAGLLVLLKLHSLLSSLCRDVLASGWL
jgi:hypothetical protein